MSALIDRRLDLFAFASAPLRHTYLGILQAFDVARERSVLQLAPADVAVEVELLADADVAQDALDALVAWGVLDRLQDDQRVRTIAEYRRRRSVYLMTELGWLAYQAVRGVVEAAPGEAELRRLVLERVHQELTALTQAVQAGDAERTALHLGEMHRMLDDLSHHASRFLIATSELSSAWEIDSESFIRHKRRLLGHLAGFLHALSAQRPVIAADLAKLMPYREQIISLAAAASVAEPAVARQRAEHRVDGIRAWFDDSAGRRSQASSLVDRTTRAIRDLTGLLRRVVDATSGGVSRSRRLEELAHWFVDCPSDDEAHALAGATSGLATVQHIGVAHADPSVEPTASWWDAPPAQVDTTLRKRGRTSSYSPPKPLPDRSQAAAALRVRQQTQRAQNAAAQERLVHCLTTDEPLDTTELAVLLRLLSRTLHSRNPVDERVSTVYGRLRMTLVRGDVDTLVPTVEGLLRLPGVALTLSPSDRLSA